MKNDNIFEVNSAADVGGAIAFLENHMNKGRRLPKKLLNEYCCLSEEILEKVIEQKDDGETCRLSVGRLFGRTVIRFSCHGSRISLANIDKEDFGAMILDEYAERIDQRYRNGNNTISISTTYASDRRFFFLLCAAVLAAVVSVVIALFTTREQQLGIVNNIIAPLEGVFTDVFVTMAVPVTFFSIAANIIFCNGIVTQNIKTKGLVIKMFGTSMLASAVGIFTGRFLVGIIRTGQFAGVVERGGASEMFGVTIPEIIKNLVPQNIIVPFMNSNPIPLMIVALVLGFGACRVSVKHEFVGNMIEGITELFNKMLELVYSFLPIVLIFAITHLALSNGLAGLLPILTSLGVIVAATIILVVMYMILLFVKGISPVKFFKEMKEILKENWTIASNFDAVSYNTRAVRLKLGINGAFLRDSFQIGARMNMDGNCLQSAAMTFIILVLLGKEINVLQMVGLVVIIIVLSFGAPNRPGSFLVCMSVITMYLGCTKDIISILIIIEAIVSRLSAMLNSVGDLVTLIASAKDNSLITKGDIMRSKKA